MGRFLAFAPLRSSRNRIPISSPLTRISSHRRKASPVTDNRRENSLRWSPSIEPSTASLAPVENTSSNLATADPDGALCDRDDVRNKGRLWSIQRSNDQRADREHEARQHDIRMSDSSRHCNVWKSRGACTGHPQPLGSRGARRSAGFSQLSGISKTMESIQCGRKNDCLCAQAGLIPSRKSTPQYLCRAALSGYLSVDVLSGRLNGLEALQFN
jgi:hypothetical protein